MQSLPFSELVQRIEQAGSGNDVYLIANNKFLQNEPFSSLLGELPELPPFLEGEARPLAASFWFGPAGTFTPLHHDCCNILFCQVFGRKRFRLMAPWWTAPRVHGCYSTQTLEQRVGAGAMGYEVLLEEGDALYLPGWWWHEATALSTSISLSLLNFRSPAAFPGYGSV